MATGDDKASFSPDVFRAAGERGTWDGVPVLAYKEDADAPFKAVTRQVLFSAADLGCELRYFEVGPGGHSTLERHEHVHAVMIFKGRGRCLVGRQVRGVKEGDLIYIPPMTWHQFRAEDGVPLGFLCMVNAQRDRPQLPTGEQLADLRSDPEVARFLG